MSQTSGQDGPERGGHTRNRSAGDALPPVDQEPDGSAPDPLVADVMSGPGAPTVGRDRREHGGALPHLDDDALAERTQRERVDAGVAAYDPDDVPPATDVAPQDDVTTDITTTQEYQEELAEVRRQRDRGELLTEDGPGTDFPPTRYSES